MYFCIKSSIGTQGEVSHCKSTLNPTVICSTDRSKAAVPVLVLLFVALWFILFVLYITLCYFILVFFGHFVVAVVSLEEERASLSAFRAFVQFVLVWFCWFPLPLCV